MIVRQKRRRRRWRCRLRPLSTSPSSLIPIQRESLSHRTWHPEKAIMQGGNSKSKPAKLRLCSPSSRRCLKKTRFSCQVLPHCALSASPCFVKMMRCLLFYQVAPPDQKHFIRWRQLKLVQILFRNIEIDYQMLKN